MTSDKVGQQPVLYLTYHSQPNIGYPASEMLFEPVLMPYNFL